MIPVVQCDQYLLALDEANNQAFLSFHSAYEGQQEKVSIQLPSTIFNAYLKEGHDDLCRRVNRINQDYQVGRFSPDNPRLMMEYILTTVEEDQAIVHAFAETMDLIKQEAISLLFSIDRDVAGRAICNEIAKGQPLPVEIFCLKFRFYNDDKPLVDRNGKELLAKDHQQSALNKLSQNPCRYCPDAILMALGALVNEDGIAPNLRHIRNLGLLRNEYVFRSQGVVIEQFVRAVNEPIGTYPDYNEEKCFTIFRDFRSAFPVFREFDSSAQRAMPHWSFLEDSFAWEREYVACLHRCFVVSQIEIGFWESADLLYLPSGEDASWHGYSIGQAERFGNVDASLFTKENVPKPVFPAAGNEDFIVGVWQHYFRFFRPTIQVTREQLRDVLQRFIDEWNCA